MVGGLQLVSGVATGTLLLQGEQELAYGGVAISTVMHGGTEVVFKATASGTMISGGLQILSGGMDTLAIDTIVDNSGEQLVQSGMALGSIIAATAFQFVLGGGAEAATIASGGFQDTEQGTIALNDPVSSGAAILDNAVLEFTDTGVSRTLFGNVTGGGEIVQAGAGRLVLENTTSADPLGSAGFAGSVIISGGIVEAAAPAALGSSTIFFGAAEDESTLQIDGLDMPANTIFGFATGDAIDLASLAYDGSTALAVDGDTVSILNGGQTYDLHIAVASADGNFQLTSGSDGGTVVSIACYPAGTQIRTETGDRPIERLQVGERVYTVGAGLQPVVWIGSTTVYPGRHSQKDDIAPVRVAAGAFGLGLPQSDLLLSPDDAIWFEGHLISIKYLIDGQAIRQLAVHRIAYFHIELPQHGVIFANGLPAESYLDVGERDALVEGDLRLLHPQFAPPSVERQIKWDAFGFAPLAITGPIVLCAKARVRDSLSARDHRSLFPGGFSETR